MKSIKKQLHAVRGMRANRALYAMGILLLIPAVAHAQSGTPFDTGLSNVQSLFTGTVAKVASAVAFVGGGVSFAHGDPGAKKNISGVIAGTGIAVLAVNVLNWLWGV